MTKSDYIKRKQAFERSEGWRNAGFLFTLFALLGGIYVADTSVSPEYSTSTIVALMLAMVAWCVGYIRSGRRAIERCGLECKRCNGLLLPLPAGNVVLETNKCVHCQKNPFDEPNYSSKPTADAAA